MKPEKLPNNVHDLEDWRQRRELLAAQLARVSILRVEEEQSIEEPND